MTEPLPIVPPSAITPAWINQALARKGINANVCDIGIETVGTGQLGETRRFHLRYSGQVPADAPRTLVGKFPSDNAVAAGQWVFIARS